MNAYRCYLLQPDGLVLDVRFSEHDTDDDAVAWAERRLHGTPGCASVELWTGDRLVRTLSRASP